MGKAVPKGIKTKAATIMKELTADVNEDFENNKKLVNTLQLPIGKWTRNVMAGFITRKVKQKNRAEKRKEELRAKAIARSSGRPMETREAAPVAAKTE
jgi:ribosomal protein S17E